MKRVAREQGSQNFSPLNLAWAAGFFDGEGTAGCYGVHKRYMRLALSQIEPTTLQRFQEAVGGRGRLYGPYTQGYDQPQWRWAAQKWSDVREVIALLWGYLSQPKRDQMMRALGERS